jgi:uncharacterized membrane protein YesL
MFSIDGKLFKTLTKMGDFLILGFLMALFSLPVITLGGSVTAAYYVALKLVRDEEGYVWHDFIKSFKMNFKQGFFIELILGAFGLFIFEDIRICMYWMNNGSNLAVFLMYAFFGLALVLVAVVLYVFALLAKFDNTVMETLKNALVLSMHHLGQTFVMLLATVILIVVTVKYFTAAILTVPICLYVNSYILARVLKIYATPETDETEEPEE